jgi:hypothetical protein
MLELVFAEKETGRVTYAITDVSRVRYVTSSEVGFYVNGRARSCSFPHTERLEIHHKQMDMRDFSLGTPEQIARQEKRYALRKCGCPPKLTACLSEENPQGHNVGCVLWGTDQTDVDEATLA